MIEKQLDYSYLVGMGEALGESEEETLELREMVGEARKYIEGFEWCGSISEVMYGDGCPGIFVLCLFFVENIASPLDDKLWVMYGDIPPAYLVTDELSTPNQALDQYVKEMTCWVEAVKHGMSLGHLIPVNAPPTLAAALDLERRLNFIRSNFLESTGA